MTLCRLNIIGLEAKSKQVKTLKNPKVGFGLVKCYLCVLRVLLDPFFSFHNGRVLLNIIYMALLSMEMKYYKGQLPFVCVERTSFECDFWCHVSVDMFALAACNPP